MSLKPIETHYNGIREQDPLKQGLKQMWRGFLRWYDNRFVSKIH